MEGLSIIEQLEKLRITSGSEIPPHEFLYTWNGVPCYARGELVAVTGKAKSGKTYLNSLLMAAAGVQGTESGESYSPETEERSRIVSGTTNKAFLCCDEDYETAEMIGNKLLLHMATAYRMIDGDAQEVVPEIKPIDQRKVLFEQLKAEYALGELISEAKSQGVSRSSAIRWNNQWIEQGLITKENHGNYKKVA